MLKQQKYHKIVLLVITLGLSSLAQARFKNITADNFDYAHQRMLEQIDKAMNHARDSHAKNGEISAISKHLIRAKSQAEEVRKAYRNAMSAKRDKND